MKQTWTITTTPRARLQLAILLLHRDLKVKGRADEKKLYRARTALGLIGISESVLKNNYDLKAEHLPGRRHHPARVRAHDRIGGVDSSKAIEPLEINSASALFLEPLLEQIESQADAADADTAEPFDERAELPRWEPRYLAAPPDDDDPDQADEPSPYDEPPPPPPPPPPRDDDRPPPEQIQMA